MICESDDLAVSQVLYMHMCCQFIITHYGERKAAAARGTHSQLFSHTWSIRGTESQIK